MPTYHYPFSGGADAVPGWGDRWNIIFGGTWAFQDEWTISVTSTEGDFTWGAGNMLVDANGVSLIGRMSSCFTFKERVYVAEGSQFNFSDNLDPTGWEEQNPGAGDVQYLSQYGAQDTVVGFGVSQGRLAVIGRRTVQIWVVDAEPVSFSLQQVLDNVGAYSALGIQQLGDFDVIIPDDTGLRSLRTKEVTLNAYVDDIGTPIDSIIRGVLLTLTEQQKAAACSIVELETRNYWFFLKDTIYVLARHPTSKVSAWSTYEPRGSDGNLFTPTKFVVLSNRTYARATSSDTNDYLYTYGGSDNNTYDPGSPVTFITPYLDDKRPGTKKTFQSLMTVMQGRWTLSLSADAQSNNYVPFYAGGDPTTPNSLTDSTYDIGRIRAQLVGTHFSIKGVGSGGNTSAPMKFSAFTLFYNQSEVQ